MKTKFVSFLITSSLVLSASQLFAGGGVTGPPPGLGGDTSGPIDSGAVVLLIAVAVYGYLRLKQKGQLEAE